MSTNQETRINYEGAELAVGMLAYDPHIGLQFLDHIEKHNPEYASKNRKRIDEVRREFQMAIDLDKEEDDLEAIIASKRREEGSTDQ